MYLQRKAELIRWVFECTCPACETSEDARKGEEKCAKMFDLDQKLTLASRVGEWAKMRKLAQKLAAMQQKEGFVGGELSQL
jgi:hypothetical protein